jgi:AcrR family transcriptional regulator
MEKVEIDMRSRLQGAALELFAERGYDRTTAAEIAARTGVTERTFFRHFPDKREVLFDGEALLRAALTEAIAAVPVGGAPLDVLFESFRSVLPLLEANRRFALPRHVVIASTPALREREIAKHDALAKSLAQALTSRGVADLPASLAAHAGMAAFVHATVAWLDDPAVGLAERVDLAHQALRQLLR